MKNNKKKKNIIIAFAVIIVLVSAFLGTLYYITSTVNNYSYTEKKWISENTDTIYDIYVEPSLPIFSNNGKGVYYEYLNALKEDTGLSLNIVTTDSSDLKLINKNYANNDDIIVFKDHFIVIGEQESISKLNDLSNKTIGILESDQETISLYLTAYNINIKSFTNYNELSTAYDNKTIDYMIIPMYKYINDIVTNDYEIAYHLDGLYSYYCLELNSKNENTNNETLIITKNIKTLQTVLPYLEEKGVLDIIQQSASILSLTIDEIKEREKFIEGIGENISNKNGTKFNSIFGLSRRKYAQRVEKEKNKEVELW